MCHWIRKTSIERKGSVSFKVLRLISTPGIQDRVFLILAYSYPIGRCLAPSSGASLRPCLTYLGLMHSLLVHTW